jgi:uncharacterized protein YlzI (FlbEa/FlbD family)
MINTQTGEIMKHLEDVLTVMESLVIATDVIVGEVMAGKTDWSAGQSARVQSKKRLEKLTQMGKLEKGEGYYRLPGCKSEWKEHAQLLTKMIAEILKLPYRTFVLREKPIEEVAMRPDALCLIINGDKAACLVIEVCNNETEDYLKQKVNTWIHWQGAKNYLGKLFGFAVPHFFIAVSGGTVVEGTIDFKDILEELK